MEIGGLMVYAYKIFLGNPDVMMALLTWAVIVTVSLTIMQSMKESNS